MAFSIQGKPGKVDRIYIESRDGETRATGSEYPNQKQNEAGALMNHFETTSDASRSYSGDGRERHVAGGSVEDVSTTAGGERHVADRSADDASRAPAPETITELAIMPATAYVTERGLAKIFRVTDRTIRNMVSRGELPTPIDLAGRSTWTAGRIIAHIDALMDRASKNNQQWARKAQ